MPDTKLILELVGYFASLLVLVSFLMSSVVKLRIINMIGSFIFAIYALLIGSYPTAIMNFCLVGINIYYLIRLKQTDKYYVLLPTEKSDAYFTHFLNFYKENILSFFPSFDVNKVGGDKAFVVYCDMVAAGVLVGKETSAGNLEILLDYTTPQYRDCSIGTYLYQQLKNQGYRTLTFAGDLEKHEDYLKKMGFHLREGIYTKDLF